jgi:hypothetical protein
MILAFASRGAMTSPPRTSGILGDLEQQTHADALPGRLRDGDWKKIFLSC